MITITINTFNFEFHETCGACPEQYDVFLEGKQVGYVRLRWGGLRCDFPDVGSDTIYHFSFDNGYLGCFPNDESRDFHLQEIAKAIYERLYAY